MKVDFLPILIVKVDNAQRINPIRHCYHIFKVTLITVNYVGGGGGGGESTSLLYFFNGPP